MASKIYTVTVASGSAYPSGTGSVFYLDGVRNATGPGTVDWVAGATIRFDQSNATNDNHPLVFSTNTSTSGIISANVTYYLDGSSNQSNYTNTATFNSGTTRYIEITPQSQTDFYYLCYIHGISMGGIMNMTQDTWSALAWNDGQWGDQDNITLKLSGFPLPMGLGDESSTPSTGWSSQAWSDNAWGSHISTIKPSGQPMTTSQGSVQPFGSSGWGGLAWNVGTWGNVNAGDQIVTGFAMSMSTGQLSQTSSTGWGRSTWGSQVWNGFGDVIPSGLNATMSLDNNTLINTEINAGWGRLGWNVNAWGIRGQATANGQAMSMSLDNVVIDGQVNTGWSSDGWGVEGWGASIQVVQLTGQNMTAFEGSAGLSFDGDSNVDAVGRAMTIAQGEEATSIKVGPILTGLPLGMSLSFEVAVIPAAGISMTAALGTAVGDNITIAEINAFSVGYWGYRSAWGNFAWGNGTTNTLVMAMSENFSGTDPAPDASLTGQAMAMALAAGDTFLIQGDANIAVLAAMTWGNGTWSESTWGDGLYRPDTDDIFPMTMALGTAVLEAVTQPTITGLGVQQVQLGTLSALADANVIATGNGLTFNLGTGTNVLIWNEVPTGSAPVTPPGWQEVPTNAA